jgi:hypothetical protein
MRSRIKGAKSVDQNHIQQQSVGIVIYNARINNQAENWRGLTRSKEIMFKSVPEQVSSSIVWGQSMQNCFPVAPWSVAVCDNNLFETDIFCAGSLRLVFLEVV